MAGGAAGWRGGKQIALLSALAVVAAGSLGLGLWIGSGGLNAPTPPIIYVNETAAPTPTVDPRLESPAAAPSLESAAAASPTVQPITSPSASPTASATSGPAATTPKPSTTKPPVPTTAPEPDLAVSVFEISRQAPSCGFTFHVTVGVHNNGPGATSRVVPVKINDAVGNIIYASTSTALPVMLPGGSLTLDMPLVVSAGCGQTHTLWLAIDPDNLNDETSTMNNYDMLNYFLA